MKKFDKAIIIACSFFALVFIFVLIVAFAQDDTDKSKEENSQTVRNQTQTMFVAVSKFQNEIYTKAAPAVVSIQSFATRYRSPPSKTVPSTAPTIGSGAMAAAGAGTAAGPVTSICVA